MSNYPEESIRRALLATFTSGNLQEIQEAEAFLKNLQFDLHFITNAFITIGKNKSWSETERLALCVSVKNTILNWDEDSTVKNFPVLRDALFTLLFDVCSDINIRNVVVSIVRKFFGCVDLAGLDALIFGLLQSGNNDLWKMQGSLILMNELTKQIGNRNATIQPFMNMFGELLLNLYVYLSQETMKNENTVLVMINMRYNIVKSLWHLFRKSTPDIWKNNPAQLSQWCDAFVHTFKSETEIMFQKKFPPTSYFFKEKRRAGNLVYLFYNRFVDVVKRAGSRGKKKKPANPAELKLSELFLQQYSVHFMEIFIEILRGYISFESNLPSHSSPNDFVPNRVIAMLIIYLDGSVSNNSIFNHVWKPHLKSFFSQVLFPFITFKKEDYRLMQESPNDFLFQNYEENEDIYSLRISAAQVFYELLGYRHKEVIGPFFEFVSEMMSNVNTSPQDLDGVMYLILHLKQVIDVEDESVGLFLQKIIVEKVFGYTQSNTPFLVARSICFIGETNFLLEPVQLKNATQLILNAINNNDVVVKVQAVVALSKIVDNDEIRENIKPLVPNLLKVYTDVMSEIENSTLVASLSAFGNYFATEMLPYAVETCGSTVDLFMRLAQLEDEDEDGQLYDACSESLRTLYNLLNAVLQNGENSSGVFQHLEEKMLPMFMFILQDDSIRFIESAMQLLTLYTYSTQTLSDNVWNLFPAIIKSFYDLRLYDFMNHLLAPLDNFISYGTDRFLSQPEYVKAVFDIIATYLSDNSSSESACQAPAKLLSVLFQNCSGRLDAFYTNSFNMVLSRLSASKTPALKILLLDAISDLIYYNPLIGLQLLESSKSFNAILKIWTQSIESMTRLYDMRISSIGLSRLLEISLQNKDSAPSVASAAPQVCKNVLQLLSKIQGIMEEQRKKEEALELERQRFEKGDKNALRSAIKDILNGDVEENSITQSVFFQDIMSQLREVDYDDVDGPDDNVLAEETVSTPLDDIDVFNFFGACTLNIKNTNEVIFNQLVQQLDAKSRNQLQILLQNMFQ